MGSGMSKPKYEIKIIRMGGASIGMEEEQLNKQHRKRRDWLNATHLISVAPLGATPFLYREEPSPV